MVSKMQIMKSIYKKLLNMPSVPPEMGGILGSKNNVIDEIKFDRKITSCESGIYVPEVKILNKYIQEWNERGIQFQGFFHTHAFNWSELSQNDKEYIVCIMKAMPEVVNQLYFPLVFPNSHVRGFLAKKVNGDIEIIEDVIEVV